MTYEINNVSLFDLLRNRPCPVLRRKCRSVVWPRRLADVPAIPFKTYDATVRRAFRDADAANQRCEAYINELNAQRGVGELVQPGELHQGIRPGDHGERTTPG